MDLKRVHHAGIAVASLAEMDELLSGRLGLERVRDFTSPTGNLARFYRLGDFEIEVVQYAPKDSAARLEGARARIDHLAIEVEDLERTIEALAALGIGGIRQSAPTGSSFRTDKVSSGGLAIQFLRPADGR